MLGRVSEIGTLMVWNDRGVIENVMLNGVLDPSMRLTINGDSTVQILSGTAPVRIGAVYIDQLAQVNKFTVLAQSKPIFNVIVNSRSTALLGSVSSSTTAATTNIASSAATAAAILNACLGTRYGSIYIESTSSTSQIGTVSLAAAALVSGDVAAQVHDGSLNNFTMSNGGTACPGLTISGQVSVRKQDGASNGRMTLFRIVGLDTIASNVLVDPGAQTFDAVQLQPVPGFAASIGGDVTVRALTNGGLISQCSVGPISRVRDVTVQANPGDITTVQVTSLNTSAFTVTGSVTVYAYGSGASSQGIINSVLLSNVGVVQGSILVQTDGGASVGGLINQGVRILSAANHALSVRGNIFLVADSGSIQLVTISAIRECANLIINGTYGDLLQANILGGASAATFLQVNNISITGWNLASSNNVLLDRITIDRISLINSLVIDPLKGTLGSVAINSAASAPPLVIQQGITIGGLALCSSAPCVAVAYTGALTISQLQSVGGPVRITTSCSSTVSLAPITITGFSPGAILNNVLNVSSTDQRVLRTITLTDIAAIGAGITNASAPKFDVYKTAASAMASTVILNSRTISSAVDAITFNGTNFAQDPECVNYCSGHGMVNFQTAGNCSQAGCACWPLYSSGSNGRCQTSVPVCTAAPASCDCLCSNWTAWQTLAQGVQLRRRNCSSTTCLTTEIVGDIECQLNQFESSPPTATSVRACSAISSCLPPIKYTISEPTAFADRICSNTTVCTPLQFETVAPTASSDRVCNTTRVCANGTEVELFAPSATTDRVCRACSGEIECGACLRCIPGSEYVSLACDKPAHDTECAPCNVCRPGQYRVFLCDGFNNTRCNNITACNATTQYQLSSPTATTDRVCRAVLPDCDFIGTGRYELRPPTATSNRICSTVSDPCDTTEQYEAQPPTPTSDRVCSALAVCDFPNSTYEATPPTYDTNRQCLPLRVCDNDSDSDNSNDTSDPASPYGPYSSPPTEYQSVAPTFTSNRQCLPLRVCNDIDVNPDNATEYESVAPTPTTNRQCSVLRKCLFPTSQYQLVAPTYNSNRQCASLRVCNVSASASPREYESTAPTYTSNRECLPVQICNYPSAEYQSVPATATTNRQCSPLRVCNFPQEYQSTAATPTSDRNCSASTVCNSATQYETRALNLTQDRQCTALTVPCSQLQPVSQPALGIFNYYQRRPPTATTDRECVATTPPCDFAGGDGSNGGMYQNHAPTATSDRSCAAISDCVVPSEIYELRAPTLTSDRVCANVTASCNINSSYESQPPTVTSDRKCMPLAVCQPPATYENVSATATSNRVCADTQVCMPPAVMIAEATLTSNRVCQVSNTSFNNNTNTNNNNTNDSTNNNNSTSNSSNNGSGATSPSASSSSSSGISPIVLGAAAGGGAVLLFIIILVVCKLRRNGGFVCMCACVGLK